MDFKPEAIGSRLLEAITSGLYDGNLNCLREYVQNAIDSGEPKEILISLDSSGTNIEIEDDGSGMNREDLTKALNVGISEKTDRDIGWRGIGIWSGVPACQRIVIITKKRGSEKLRIVIDNEVIRHGYFSNKNLTEILTQATSEIEECPMGKGESIDEDHYTTIRLEGIRPSQKYWYNKKRVLEYLQKTIPAPIDPSFKKAGEINKFLGKHGIKDRELIIKFNGDPISRPPMNGESFFDVVTTKEFKVEGKLVAVGWAMTCNNNRGLQPPDKGIFFKKKGFTIGDENLVRNRLTGTYHWWQYGEIHILEEAIKENSARNDFEYDSSMVDSFMNEVRNFIRVLEQQNHFQTAKLAQTKTKSIEKLISDNDNRKALRVIKKTEERLSSPRSPPKDPDLAGMVAVIERESKKQLATVRKQRKTVEKKIKASKHEVSNKLIDDFVNALPPAVKKSVRRVKKANILDLELNVAEPLLEALQNRIGSTENEMSKITRIAYGWSNVNLYKDDPKIVLDTRKGERHCRNRNLQLGVMLFTVHDLFVNLPKHAKGQQPLQWYEGQSTETQIKLRMWMAGTLALMIHLVEQSEDYKP